MLYSSACLQTFISLLFPLILPSSPFFFLCHLFHFYITFLSPYFLFSVSSFPFPTYIFSSQVLPHKHTALTSPPTPQGNLGPLTNFLIPCRENQREGWWELEVVGASGQLVLLYHFPTDPHLVLFHLTFTPTFQPYFLSPFPSISHLRYSHFFFFRPIPIPYCSSFFIQLNSTLLYPNPTPFYPIPSASYPAPSYTHF